MSGHSLDRLSRVQETVASLCDMLDSAVLRFQVGIGPSADSNTVNRETYRCNCVLLVGGIVDILWLRRSLQTCRQIMGNFPD